MRTRAESWDTPWASSKAPTWSSPRSTWPPPSRSSGTSRTNFFRGQDWQTFESFKADLNAYITYWNTTRRQVKLKGLTPAEYRDQALQQAA
ncbi:IS3 family transposase [Actinomyces bouchesdurhonensis]|uniref:IS3 family transposase n=1 Tax=Actinomyces bouchesdurhonensis TaxID=1852361 RepID=UPI001F29190B|nr:IS3 family transposase [Actinomyces bouchesdurhonensis]